MLFALMPHGYCFLWNIPLTLLHALSDGAIAIAYCSIPTIIYLNRNRADTQIRPLVMMFAIFILACGVGHSFTVWNIWHGSYWIEGFWKAVTAVVSLLTAWKLRQTLPHMMGIYSQLAETELLAMTDPLTGINNRHGLKEAFKHLSFPGVEIRENCMMLIDLDHFKKVNDSYGHAAGDLVLKKVAKILKKHSRAIDIVARIGGDEFAVLLLECSLVDGKRIAENIRQAVAQITLDDLPPDEGKTGLVTTSIGVMPFTLHQSYEDIYRLTDQLLYHSKNSGRNQVIHSVSESERS